MEEYPFSTRHNGYLLFVGRISQEKGVHFAIEAANTLHMPLIIAAKLDAVDVPYFKEKIEPHLSDNIQWIGEVNERKRNELMSKAQCVLHPTNWHEPFGLTLIEAMACGAPVVAYNKGSIPEIIKDGYNGFLVKTPYEMRKKLEVCLSDPDLCKEIGKNARKTILERFSLQQFIDNWNSLFEEASHFVYRGDYEN
jgi:glycosyltransferase involved in cell wall biosynthesis